MFNWSGKQSLNDDPSDAPSYRKNQRSSSPSPQSDLESFDHAFKGAIHTIECADDYLAVFGGNCAYENRPVKITCSVNSFQVSEEVTLSKINRIEISYRKITGVTWDHANSEVKLDLHETFIIFRLARSVEFEKELRLRLAKASSSGDYRNPTPMYVGIFAGPNKPKPFQRKRPNLSNLAQAKLPSLKEMRTTALDLKNGSYQPCATGESRRIQLAYQHIYEGFNTFKLVAVRGATGIADMFIRSTSLLCVQDDKLVFKPQGDRGTSIEFSFEDMASWVPIDNEGGHSRGGDSGIELHSTGGEKVYFAVNYVRDIKHTLEYYWNKYQTSVGRPPLLGSTHGRPIVSVSTLSGEVRASSIPVGSTDVVDIDGIIVRPGGKMAIRNTSVTAIKGLMGTVEEPRFVPNQVAVVAKHWSKVVLHQGWLLKQGGAGVGSLKSWIKRYFVLYKTSQGHVLVYYADFTECPLYSADRNARNIVDLAKATYIRPGSEGSDVPNHSFDIVTIEREWTLCAETEQNLQTWLKVLTHAVDEDVAILPDEEIVYKVKPKQDPSGVLNATDYSTSLKVSAHGVAVTVPSGNSQNSGASLEKEVFFWVYTDFFKWSLVLQNEKPALSVNVFTDATFQKKIEYQFRYKEAHKIATAIEFFIEKFMSVMHIRLELSDPDAANAADLAEPEVLRASRHTVMKEVKEEHRAPEKEIDLLGFDDDLPPVPARAASVSLLDDPFAPPAPIPTQPAAPAASFAHDPFGSDPFADPAPAVSVAAPSFLDDPFADSSFVAPVPAQPKVTLLPALSAAQTEQMSAWWLASIAGAGGPMYDDGVLQIASKVEIRGSQGRVTLFYRNYSEADVSAVTTSLVDPTSFLRYDLGAVDASIPASAKTQQVIMVECINSVYPGPSMHLSYTVQAGGALGKREIDFVLPIALASFNEPLALSAQDFLVRWNALALPGQESVVVFDCAHATSAVAHKILTTAGKFGYVEGVVDASIGVAGAATLRMGSNTVGEKVNVGCLVKVEINAAVGKVRVSSRTTQAAASEPVAALFRAFLIQGM